MALTGVPDALLVAVLMWNGRLGEAYAHCRAIVAGMPDGFPGAPGGLRPIALLGNLLMLGGQLDEALKYTQMDRGANPGNYFSHINAANVLGLLGRKDEAAAAWADAKDLAPALTVAGFRKGYSRVFVDPKLAEGFSDGLLAAGLE